MNQVEKDAESIIKKLIRDPVSSFNRYALLAERMGKLGIGPATG